MRGSNGLRSLRSRNNLGRAASTELDFIAIGVDDTGSGLILGLKFDLALERLNLLLVEKVAILIAVLDLLLPRDNTLTDRVGTRLLLGDLLLLVRNRLLDLRRRISHSRPLRCGHWGLGRRRAGGGNSVVVVVLIMKR